MEDGRYNKIGNLFKDIKVIKMLVVGLHGEQLRAFKHCFYRQSIRQWQLDVLWEFIWGDLTYDQIDYILRRR